MSSGAHLSKELHDIIKSIGETRSKQEEDKIILAEQQKLKEKINEKNQSQRRQKENLLKAIYIEMLGHDASFCYIHAVNMSQSKQLQMKRLGYLCCCLFLNEDSEFLILLVANLQRDLTSTSVHEIIIALTALSKLMNHTILNGLLDQVIKLLTHTTDLVRKKAVMVLQKVRKLNPTLISDFDEKIRRALCDKEPSVMGASLNLYYDVIKENAGNYKDTTSSFVLILKQIIEHKLPREFDYHRIPAPWIQIKILQILSLLGANDLRVSEQIYEILGQALRRSDDTGINIGHAVTYQCVKTIASIYPNQALLESAAQSVSKFLTAENNNLKYMGINALISIVQVDPKYVLEHQLTIVDCLENKDETLKRETLELLYKMTNNQNIITIIDKLIFFLKSAHDQHFRKDLVNKICQLSEKFAPNQEWFMKIMNTVFEYGAEFIDNHILNNFLKLLNENYSLEGPEFGQYIIEQYIQTIQKPNIADITIKMISWVFGEIGSQIYQQNSEKLNQLTEILLTCITNELEQNSTRSWIMNALGKLYSCPGFELTEQVNNCFEYYEKSKNIELCQRSRDYLKLQKYNAALRQSQLVNFDEKLPFLQTFLQAAQQRGDKEYDRNKALKAIMGNSQQDSGLYFESKPSERLVTIKPKNDKDEVQVKFKGDSKWSVNGYEEPKKESVAPVFFSENKTAISSEDYKGKQSNINNGVNVYRSEEKPTYSDVQQKKDVQKKEQEDPQKKEKEQLMNGLFSGVSSISTQKPVYAQYKTQAAQQTQQQQPTTSTGNNLQNTQKQQQDLLDLLDGQPSKPPQQQQPQQQVQQQAQQKQGPPVFGAQSQKQGPPVFGNPQVQVPVQQQTQIQQQGPPQFGKPQIQQPQVFGQQQPFVQQPQVQQTPPVFGKPQNQQPPVFGQQPFGQQPQVFGQQQVIPQQQIQIPPQMQFQAHKITVDQYQEEWEVLTQETQQVINSKQKSENDVKNMIGQLGFTIIEIIDNEFICASKTNQANNIFLMYVVYNKTNFQLDIIVKSKIQNDNLLVFNKIKSGYC